MDMNSPLEIVGKIVILGLFAGGFLYFSSLTVREAMNQVVSPFLDLALQHPLFAGVFGLSVVFLILFGDKGDGGAGGGG